MEKKIKSIETGEDIVFSYRLVTMPIRENFVDAFLEAEASKPQKFSLWVKAVRVITTLSDDELMKFTDNDIYQIAYEAMIDHNNKKKVEKKK